MDEMTAFERQLAAELRGMVGPVPPFDIAAITRTAATASPPLRSQTMSGALKLVAAGAVVALFGGFAIMGVVSVRQSDQLASGAASPSPTTTESLLAEMVTEEVEPGVFRIFDDRAGHDLMKEPPFRVAVGPDDAVWLLGGSGQHSAPLAPGVRVATSLTFGPSGTGWVYLDTSPDPAKPTDRAFMARLADGVWDVYEAPSGYTHYYTATQLAVDAEDRAWIWFELRWPRELPARLGRADVPPGILSFDGQTWRRHLEGVLIHDVAFASDGSTWVTSRYGCDRDHTASWDGGGQGPVRVLGCGRRDTNRAGLYVITPETMAVAK